MKKVIIHAPGGYERLVIKSQSTPIPGPDEVLIDVAAIGVNYADCITRMGLYASAKQYIGYPITPGFEVAGTVKAIGSGISDLVSGMPVMAVTRFNGYATQLVTKRSLVFPIPDSLSVEAAAGFPTISLAAWYGLYELAQPDPTKTILVHSAAGGVGSMLVQLGKIAGCRVIGVVGHGHKVTAVRELGADAVIDKSSQDLWKQVNKLAPSGCDIILDANGVTTLAQSYRRLTATGRLVVYGFHGMLPKQGGIPHKLMMAWDYLRTPRFSPFDLCEQNRGVLGFNMSFLFDHSDLMNRGLSQLIKWLNTGKIVAPKITLYPFEKVADAHRDLESGETIGKLVLVCKGFCEN